MRYSVYIEHFHCPRGDKVECIADGVEGSVLVQKIIKDNHCHPDCRFHYYTDKELSINDSLEKFLDARILKLKEETK